MVIRYKVRIVTRVRKCCIRNHLFPWQKLHADSAARHLQFPQNVFPNYKVNLMPSRPIRGQIRGCQVLNVISNRWWRHHRGWADGGDSRGPLLQSGMEFDLIFTDSSCQISGWEHLFPPPHTSLYYDRVHRAYENSRSKQQWQNSPQKHKLTFFRRRKGGAVAPTAPLWLRSWHWIMLTEIIFRKTRSTDPASGSLEEGIMCM